jgi:hypothetical protein
MFTLKTKDLEFEVTHLIHHSSRMIICMSAELGGLVYIPIGPVVSWDELRSMGYRVIGLGLERPGTYYKLEVADGRRQSENNHVQNGREGVRCAVYRRVESQGGLTGQQADDQGFPKVSRKDTTRVISAGSSRA